MRHPGKVDGFPLRGERVRVRASVPLTLPCWITGSIIQKPKTVFDTEINFVSLGLALR
jgi:hypothetical protein